MIGKTWIIHLSISLVDKEISIYTLNQCCFCLFCLPTGALGIGFGAAVYGTGKYGTVGLSDVVYRKCTPPMCPVWMTAWNGIN